MKYQLRCIYRLFAVVLVVIVNMTYAQQYPGNVSTGTARGYKVDYYNGSFTSVSQFGAGTSNANPARTGYSNKISGTEFNNADVDYYGMEYTGTLEITTGGSYTFQMTADDYATLYIDGNPIASANYTNGAVSVSYPLPAGNHGIKLKFYEAGGANYATLRFTAVPASATGFTLPADIDGRFVRYDNAKMTAWYKASDLGVTANGGGTGIDKVNSWINKAPDYAGTGNMAYYTTSGSSATTSNATMVNFNPAVLFDGNDVFASNNVIKGLSFRGATKTMFGVANYTSNPGQDNAWLFLHLSSTSVTNGSMFGLYKTATGSQTAVSGSGSTFNSAWTAFEPKLLTGTLGQLAASNAPNNTNPIYAGINGVDNSPVQLNSNVVLQDVYGLRLSTEIDGNKINTARLPEFIYYPWELSASDKQKVNSYLGIKYGITLGQSYVNTSGTEIFGLTTNAGYINRIFGIGREDIEGLHQKISQSQMTSKAGYDFLLLSKGDVSATNAANNGNLTNNSYLLVGDDNVNFTPISSNLPLAFTTATGCTVNRLGRSWKAQVTGSPNSITVRAGSSTANSFKFPLSASGLVLIIDEDGNGNFTNGVYRTYPVTNLVNGVATFKGVTLNTGEVFTFAWSVISPGGVSAGLKLWTKADQEDLAVGNVSTWQDFGPSLNNLTRTPSGNVAKVANMFNFNPAIKFDGNGPPVADNTYLQSNASLAMNGSTTLSEFYVLKGIYPSGLGFDEIISIGTASSSSSHRWENNTSTTATARYGAYGNGTAQNDGTGGPMLVELGLYSNLLNGSTATLNSNGVTRFTYTSASPLSAVANFRIGSDVYDDGNGNFNGFYSPELIIYNTALSATDLTKVNSYLGIKYSIPLANGSGTSASDYFSANGTKIWLGDSTYKFDMFGIGRDDCSGLNQKQSKAYFNSTDNVTIGKGAIVGTNEDNKNEFAANTNFVVIANDGGSFAGITTNNATAYVSCNPYRYARTWKVKNTGGVTGLQIQIGNATNFIPSNWANVALIINANGDNNFSTATVINASSINGGVATFNDLTLPDGAVFTLAYTVGTPGGLSKPTAGSTTLGSAYVNGLAYKLYEVTGAVNRNLATNPLNTVTDALVSTGYYNNASNGFQAFFTNKRTANFGFELSGKILAPRTGIYTFRSTGADDQLRLMVNGAEIFNVTNYVSGSTIVTGTITLNAGQYYDFVYTGATNASGYNFNLTWDGPLLNTQVAISDANFFVSPNGPSAWYMADDLDLSFNFTEGTTVSTWKDLSGNGNTLTVNGNPTFYNTNNTYITNYNPSVYFTTDYLGTSNYLNGFAYGKQGKSLFETSANSSGTATIYTAYGNDATGNLFGLNKFASGQLMLLGYNNNTLEAGTFYGNTTSTTDIISGKYVNQNLLGVNNTNLYANGTQLATATQNTWNTIMKSAGQFFIGAWPGAAASFYTNNVNEVIYYPWDLSNTELQKVNSYLAVKWGTTLDQSTATNYLASDASIIWNSAGVGLFKNDITVIGRDDCGAINQRQSTSTDGNDIVSMGKGPLAINNASNTNNFSADKSFVAIAHNSAALLPMADLNLPASLVATSCYSRLTREWQAQVKGTAGVVSLELGKTGLYTFGASTYKPVLIVRPKLSTNYSAIPVSSIYNATKTTGGKVYFDNVNLTDGDIFTVAFIEAAPGGVKNNLTVWLDAGKETYIDNAGTTPAVAADDKVGYLKNIATNIVLQNVNQATDANKPVLKLADINYNPALAFSFANLNLASGSVSSNAFRTTSAMSTFAAGWNVGGSGATDVIWGHFSGAGSGVSMRKGSINWANTNISSSVVNSNPPGGSILSATYTSTSGKMFLNADNNGILSGSTSAAGNAAFILGSASSNVGYDMGEIITYNDDKSTVPNLNDRYKISSYLGVKYGFTQVASGMNNAYIASNGTVIFDYTAYWTRITGIGRDDCSAFEQKQALSQDSGALVKISTDTTNGMAASNAANTVSFTTDKSFLLFGDNNLSLAWNGNQSIAYNSSLLMPLMRVWRVKETGTVANPVGSVYISVPDYTASGTKLPAATNNIYMLVSNTAGFTTPTVVPMIPDGTNWTVTYDFANGDYYTFATETTCIAPGGISNGLTTWYKATDMATGSIAGGTANALIDQTGNHNLASVNAGITVNSGSSAEFNYNRNISFGSTGHFAKLNLNETAITALNNGMMFATGSSHSNLMSLSNTTQVAAGFRNNNAVFAGQLSASATFASPTATTNNYVSWFFQSVNQRLGATVNGFTNYNDFGVSPLISITPATDYGLRVGATYVGPTLTYNGGKFAEAMTYNRKLTDAEFLNLNTYVALKYGQTMAHNYYSPSYDGTNATSTTLYDISTYGNRVFGVGRHIAGCFAQNQSNSILTGSMLRISIDGALLAENSQDASKWVDQSGNTLDQAYLVMGDNAGSVSSWNTVGATKPLLYQTDARYTCAQWLSREWKVVTTKEVPELYINLPQASLPSPIPAGYSVYMIVNDIENFETAGGNELEVAMLPNTNAEWETRYSFPANTTKYITFAIRPNSCGLQYIITNPATSTQQLKY